MKVLVTGATGFVGRHTVTALLAEGHTVTAVARDRARLATMPWHDQVHFIAHDLHEPALNHAAVLGVPDALVHLAWPGLPNYRELFHFEHTLPADYAFLKQMIVAGTPQVLVTGTCFEYGMKSGELSESMPADPQNPYALAKDTLRKFLQSLQAKHPFILQWARLFYMYGQGQNASSLIAQLDRAIDSGAVEFDMSPGEQLRDYLPVTVVADHLSHLLGQTTINGIINCCSGLPLSVRGLVERRIAERNAGIALNRGTFAYSPLEPMAFWGDRRKLDTVLVRGNSKRSDACHN